MVRLWRTVSASSHSATHARTRRVLSTGIPLLSLGPTRVDVLPVGSILHQRDVVVSGEREVGDAAHQPPQVLPVRVQGDFLHAPCGKGSSQKLLLTSTSNRSCLAGCIPSNAIPTAPQKGILIYRLLCVALSNDFKHLKLQRG